jgi:hypothetical protein
MFGAIVNEFSRSITMTKRTRCHEPVKAKRHDREPIKADNDLGFIYEII